MHQNSPAYRRDRPRLARGQAERRFQLSGLALLALWCLLITLPFFWMESWTAKQQLVGERFNASFQIAGAGLATVYVLLNIGRVVDETWKAITTRLSVFFLFFYLLIQILLAPASISVLTTLAYGFLTLIAAMFCITASRLGHHGTRPVLWTTLAFLVALIFIHGFNGETVGGIQPNQYAKAAIFPMILAMLIRDGRWWIFAIFAVIAAVLVTSRGAILFLALFWTAYLLIVAPGKTIRLAIIFGFPALALLAALQLAGLDLIGVVANDILHLNDAYFGIEGGFSGRTEHWDAAFPIIADNPIFGYGFRTRGTFSLGGDSMNAHQGFLNLMLDSGLVGFAFFMLAIAFALVERLPRTTDSLGERHRKAVLFGFILGAMGILAFDPLYLNIGNPFTLLFIFALCAESKVATQLVRQGRVSRTGSSSQTTAGGV